MQQGIDCLILIGLPGCGKSLYQTLTYVLPLLAAGEEVWCCYWLNWKLPNYHYFSPGDFDAVKDLRNCVIVFDELGQTFESRNWSQEDSSVRQFFQLHRHRHVTIIGNTQDISLVAKTVGIIANKWYYLENNPHSWLIEWMFKPHIRINISEMSFQQLKKMANGFELTGLIEKGADEIKNYNEKIYFKEIYHRDLDEFKIERYHTYCPKCCIRSGEQITKEKEKEVFHAYSWTEKQEPTLIEKRYCQKCHTELEIRESGMYDTDYEPPQTQKNRKQIWVKKVVKEQWVVEGTNYGPAGINK